MLCWLQAGTRVVQSDEPLQEEKVKYTSKVEQARKEMEDRQRRIDELEQRIAGCEANIYADLNRKVRLCTAEA